MGKHPTGREGSWQAERLQEQHEEVARLLVAGMKPKMVAKAVGMTPEHISNIRRSAVVEEKIQTLAAARDASSVDVAKRIMELAPLAIARIEEALALPIDDPNNDLKPETVLRTSQDLLDRAGFNAVQKHAHLHETRERMEKMKQDAIDAGLVIIEEADDDDIDESES